MTIPQIDTGAFREDLKCPHCDSIVMRGFDPNNEIGWERELACNHVFLMADDIAIVYLSSESIRALRAADVIVEDVDGYIDVTLNDEPLGHGEVCEVLSGDAHFEGAQVLAVYAPAPSFLGSYIGVTRASDQ